MRKDHTYQLTIAIERGSPLHQALLKDGENTGTRQLGVLAGLRLTQFYEWHQEGILHLLGTLLGTLQAGGPIAPGPLAAAAVPPPNTVKTPTGERRSIEEMLALSDEAANFFPD